MVMATVAPAGGAVADPSPRHRSGRRCRHTRACTCSSWRSCCCSPSASPRWCRTSTTPAPSSPTSCEGIGRPVGLAGAYIATTAYLALAAATGGAMGFFAAGSVDKLAGVDLPWWLYTLVGLVVGVRARLLQDHARRRRARVSRSSSSSSSCWCWTSRSSPRTASAVCRSARSAPTRSSSPAWSASGMIFAFSCYQGFEGTAIYAEEAKDPERTVPRATYISMGVHRLVLRPDVVGLPGQLRRRGRRRGREPRHVRLRPERRVRRLGVDDDPRGAHRHELLRRHAGLPQRGVALHVRPRPRRLPAPLRCGPCTRGTSRRSVAGATGYVVETLVVIGFALAGLDPLTNLSAALTGFGAVGLMLLITDDVARGARVLRPAGASSAGRTRSRRPWR